MILHGVGLGGKTWSLCYRGGSLIFGPPKRILVYHSCEGKDWAERWIGKHDELSGFIVSPHDLTTAEQAEHT